MYTISPLTIVFTTEEQQLIDFFKALQKGSIIGKKQGVKEGDLKLKEANRLEKEAASLFREDANFMYEIIMKHPALTSKLITLQNKILQFKTEKARKRNLQQFIQS